MKELFELRISEDSAGLLFQPDEGIRVSESIRKIVISRDDPRFPQIGEFQRRLVGEGRSFYFGWRVRRNYLKRELENAPILHFNISRVFEPSGEECGTIYDESNVCPICGVGRLQETDLRLDLQRAPRGVGFARTIGDERIVTQDLTEGLLAAEMSGLSVREVFDVSSGTASKEWKQLIFESSPVSIADSTTFGADPFDMGDPPAGRCPFGHVRGLNLISEVHISRSTWDGSDVVQSLDHIGVRRGLLRPRTLLFISQRLYRALDKLKVKGYSVEVSHLE